MKKRNEIAVIGKRTSINNNNPFEKFDAADMERFYAAKQFLSCLDATPLLEKCILYKNEIRHYENTFTQIDYPHYSLDLLGEPVYTEHLYERDYTSETQVIISTALLMNKLDASLFFWRELNPELERLLSGSEGVRFEVIANWVKMIHYMAPTQQNVQKNAF